MFEFKFLLGKASYDSDELNWFITQTFDSLFHISRRRVQCVWIAEQERIQVYTDVTPSERLNKKQRWCQILPQLPSGKDKTNMAAKNKTLLEMITRI